MPSFDLVTLAVLIVAVGGIAAVLGEILAKDPRSLLEIATDSRRFAEAVVQNDTPGAARRSVGVAAPAANLNHPKLAA
ncbi:MAG TPA: hypothetical protein VGQ35_08100 [Dongiaceae bacterium]|jgi:hypothetical protein|nr:hypothetical protein [Dongiaceae bacterium]